MSRQITQPVNQVRLTNVAVVRLTRSGHRFEVACYRNKIINYRQGTETDLSEVLQTTQIFANVSKGQFAKISLLRQCFGTSDEEEVCRFILEKGEVQVSDLERTAQLESTLREVASMVSEKCVHPVSRRPYTMAQIRDAMKAAGFMVHPTRNVKQQFLDCVRLLQEKKVLDIERAKMQLAIVFLSIQGSEIIEKVDGDDVEERMKSARSMLVEAGTTSSDFSPLERDRNRLLFLSDPSLYRKVDAIARNASVHGRLEIIQQCVAEEGDVTLGSELERRAHHQQQQKRFSENDGALSLQQGSRNNTEIVTDNDELLLSNKLQSKMTINSSHDDDHSSNSPVAAFKTVNSRKAQKAAAKKSKKAKRREKEEQAERQRRIAAEKFRQKERAERLGISESAERDQSNGEGGKEGDTKPCNTCGGSFTSGEYRAHFRSDWHRYNVKLKIKGVAPVSEKEFLLCDSDAFFE